MLYLLISGFVAVVFLILTGIAAGGLEFSIDWIQIVYRRLRRPLIYICTVNGVTSAVRAKDFNRCRREFWSGLINGRKDNPGPTGALIHVGPAALFSDLEDHRVREGTCRLSDLRLILQDCDVEHRMFYVPDPRREDVGPNAQLDHDEFLHRRF